jgi:hypothetical protein
MPTVMSFVKKHSLTISHQHFELNCELTVALPLLQKELLKNELKEIKSIEITIKGIY